MTEATIGLVLDCSEPETLASFWAPGLGLERLGSAGAFVLLVSPAKALPNLLLQHVAEPKDVKIRMHRDSETTTVDDEVARLEALGAKRIEDQARREHGSRWIVMTDPEGNEFCVCDGGAGST